MSHSNAEVELGMSYSESETTTEDDSSKAKASSSSSIGNDTYGATPLEDRFGRPLWVRTRMCFCPFTSETDCRFHPVTEKGWEQCPHLEAAQADSKIRGRWLWARNPLYGRPLTEEEEKAAAAEKAAKQVAANSDTLLAAA